MPHLFRLAKGPTPGIALRLPACLSPKSLASKPEAPACNGGSRFTIWRIRKRLVGPDAPKRKTPSPFPKRGAGGAAPAGGTACPPVSKNVGGWARWDNGARQASLSGEGGRKPQQDHPSRKRHTPLAKYEQLCYSTPMKSAADPLLFLGACRIHEHCANRRASPCGRGAEGTPQRARPSEDGRGRSDCRCKAQAPWSHPAPLRFHYRSITVPLRFHYGSLRPITLLLRFRAYTRQNPAD